MPCLIGRLLFIWMWSTITSLFILQGYMKMYFPEKLTPSVTRLWILIARCSVSESALVQAALYVAGFPCKAFSRLRTKSDWLDDAKAKPFFGCISNLRRLQPVVSWWMDIDIFLQTSELFLLFVCHWGWCAGECSWHWSCHGRSAGPHQATVARLPIVCHQNQPATWLCFKMFTHNCLTRLCWIRKYLGVAVDRNRYYFFLVRKEYLMGNLGDIVEHTLQLLANQFANFIVPWLGAQVYKFPWLGCNL